MDNLAFWPISTESRPGLSHRMSNANCIVMNRSALSALPLVVLPRDELTSNGIDRRADST
jgi:hypothetical protein